MADLKLFGMLSKKCGDPHGVIFLLNSCEGGNPEVNARPD
jgi:hypothetical protein